MRSSSAGTYPSSSEDLGRASSLDAHLLQHAAVRRGKPCGAREAWQLGAPEDVPLPQPVQLPRSSRAWTTPRSTKCAPLPRGPAHSLHTCSSPEAGLRMHLGAPQ